MLARVLARVLPSLVKNQALTLVISCCLADWGKKHSCRRRVNSRLSSLVWWRIVKIHHELFFIPVVVKFDYLTNTWSLYLSTDQLYYSAQSEPVDFRHSDHVNGSLRICLVQPNWGCLPTKLLGDRHVACTLFWRHTRQTQESSLHESESLERVGIFDVCKPLGENARHSFWLPWRHVKKWNCCSQLDGTSHNWVRWQLFFKQST